MLMLRPNKVSEGQCWQTGCGLYSDQNKVRFQFDSGFLIRVSVSNVRLPKVKAVTHQITLQKVQILIWSCFFNLLGDIYLANFFLLCFKQNKPEDSYTSLQQPAGDLYLTAAPVNHVYVDSMGTLSVGKYKKGCLASKEQPEDIYENI